MREEDLSLVNLSVFKNYLSSRLSDRAESPMNNSTAFVWCMHNVQQSKPKNIAKISTELPKHIDSMTEQVSSINTAAANLGSSTIKVD